MPGKDLASLVPFSNLVELDEKTKEEYVESSIVPEEGLAILGDPPVYEECQVELVGAVLFGYVGSVPDLQGHRP